MPGVVHQHVEAVKEVEDYAQEYGQGWNVREAFEDNLQSWRRACPEDTHSQTVRHAIDSTKHEIRESYEAQQEREEEHIRESQGYRMRV